MFTVQSQGSSFLSIKKPNITRTKVLAKMKEPNNENKNKKKPSTVYSISDQPQAVVQHKSFVCFLTRMAPPAGWNQLLQLEATQNIDWLTECFPIITTQ